MTKEKLQEQIRKYVEDILGELPLKVTISNNSLCLQYDNSFKAKEGCSVRIIAASDGAPFETWWGDYWAKKHLSDALKKRGYTIVPNFHYNKPNNQPTADVDLFLHASKTYPYLDASIKIAWIFTRHYDALKQINYFKQLDHIFSLSKVGVEDWERVGMSTSYLPAGSAKTKRLMKPKKKYDVVFVGNARGSRPALLQYLIESGANSVAIYGTGWDRAENKRFSKYVKGKCYPNENIDILYSSAKIVLNAHEHQMLRSGGVSIKALDVMATGNFLLTDNPQVRDFAPSVVVYKDRMDMANKVRYYLNNTKERCEIAHKCMKESQEYTFDKVADSVVKEIERLRKNICIYCKKKIEGKVYDDSCSRCLGFKLLQGEIE